MIRQCEYRWAGFHTVREVRVEVVDIRSSEIAAPGKFPKIETVAKLQVNLGGGLIYGGEWTKPTGVNKYLAPRAQHHESAESIYAFHMTEVCFYSTVLSSPTAIRESRIAAEAAAKSSVERGADDGSSR